MERLKKGEDFSTVAKEVSTAASGKLGGNVGWISQGSYRIKALEEKAFTMKANDIAGPMEIDNKVFILKVTEVKQGKAIDFSSAQNQVKGKLEQEVYRKLVIAHLAELWRKSQIGPVDEFMEAVYSRLPDYETMRKKAMRKKGK
jgi:parvulin-like peptidyl-prolyl isomerase